MNLSFEQIGEYLNRKHTTIMYSHEQIKTKVSTDKNIATAIREIKQALKVI